VAQTLEKQVEETRAVKRRQQPAKKQQEAMGTKARRTAPKEQ